MAIYNVKDGIKRLLAEKNKINLIEAVDEHNILVIEEPTKEGLVRVGLDSDAFGNEVQKFATPHGHQHSRNQIYNFPHDHSNTGNNGDNIPRSSVIGLVRELEDMVEATSNVNIRVGDLIPRVEDVEADASEALDFLRLRTNLRFNPTDNNRIQILRFREDGTTDNWVDTGIDLALPRASVVDFGIYKWENGQFIGWTPPETGWPGANQEPSGDVEGHYFLVITHHSGPGIFTRTFSEVESLIHNAEDAGRGIVIEGNKINVRLQETPKNLYFSNNDELKFSIPDWPGATPPTDGDTDTSIPDGVYFFEEE